MNSSSFFTKYLASGIEGNIQEPDVRKAVIINVFAVFGLLTMSTFSIVGLLGHRYVYAATMLLFFSLLAGNVIYLRIKKDTLLPGHFIVNLMLLMEIALLTKLGTSETGILWFYLFPVLSFFVLGRSIGSIYVGTLTLITIIYFKISPEGFNQYNSNTQFRFIFSFIVTAGMTLVFEIIRAKTYQALVKTNEQKTYYLIQTEQQKEEIIVQSEKLKDSNKELEKLSIVASETTNAIKIIKPNGIIEWVNKGFSKLYGFTFNELKDRDLLDIHKIDNTINIELFIKKCLTHGEHCNYETLTERKDGKKVWVHSTLSPIYNEKDEIVKIIAIDSDISALKDAETAIKQQSEEIRAQKEALTEQNKKIEIQHEMIKGSIRYAKKIQATILPSAKSLDKFYEWAIIYRPKHIVSGDFYWFTSIESPLNEQLISYVAIVDCTGHGVPGAFMSLIGSRLLNEIVNERKILEPKDILTKLNTDVQKALRQSETDNNDGMDVAIIRFEKAENDCINVAYAGAKRNLVYYEPKIPNLQLMEGDRKGIGGKSNRMDFQFNQISKCLQKETVFYAYTDGLIDQNNAERKRFGTTKLFHILDENKCKSLNNQKLILENQFDLFKEAEDQRDDITFMFLKLK